MVPMVSLKLLASLAAVGALAPAHSPLQSRQLWATVDVCNPHDQLNTIGIRGSMPNDGNPADTLYMRFRVQYEDSATKQWVYIAKGADSGFQPVQPGHAAGTPSQSGRNFQLVPPAGPFTLRGVVSFQWRHGAHVVYAVTRTTTAGHQSVAGADPAGYTAATCTIG
jgi:hypothetical protein